MRRMRRSAEGSPGDESGARSASCDNSLCAPSGRTIRMLVAKTHITRKSTSIPLLPSYWPSSFFHLSEYLPFSPFAAERAVVLQFDVAAAKFLTA